MQYKFCTVLRPTPPIPYQGGTRHAANTCRHEVPYVYKTNRATVRTVLHGGAYQLLTRSSKRLHAPYTSDHDYIEHGARTVLQYTGNPLIR